MSAAGTGSVGGGVKRKSVGGGGGGGGAGGPGTASAGGGRGAPRVSDLDTRILAGLIHSGEVTTLPALIQLFRNKCPEPSQRQVRGGRGGFERQDCDFGGVRPISTVPVTNTNALEQAVTLRA